MEPGGAAPGLATGPTLELPPGAPQRPDAASAPPDAAPPFHRVGRFVLLERLGAGGMGVVYAAYDEQLERKVAIKLVRSRRGAPATDPSLLREAQAQARLAHPSVVTVFEVGALPDGGLFIAMELVRGGTLRAWRAAAPRSWREVLRMYVAAGEGLAAAHRAGLVHRDVKPDNILVGDDGRARVTDFGLAALPAEAGPEAGATALATPPGPAGTPGYMAPEQQRGTAVDARSDQFGFCASLYEALAGERPFADLAFLGGDRPAPRRAAPDPAHPRWLWDAIARGLSLDPAARFPSMDALLAELTRHLDRPRRRALALGGAAAVLAVGGALAALASRAPAGAPPCSSDPAELAGAWDPATRGAVEVALLGTRAPYAARVWASTAAAFDRFAEGWLAAQRSACEATHLRRVQSTAVLDRRMACLAGRRRALSAAAEVLRTRPAQALEHPGELLASLGDLAACADPVALAAGGAGADSPARTAALEQLARADALLAAGDTEAASAVVTAARAGDAALDAPTRADLAYFEGRVHLARKDVTAAVPAFDRALALAVASQHDDLPAAIWLALAVEAGQIEQRPAAIGAWIEHGEAWLQRLGGPRGIRGIQLERARGAHHLVAGAAPHARAALDRAVAAAEALWGPSDPRLIPLLRERARAHARLADARAAAADIGRARDLGLAAYGPDHPDLAATRLTLGLLYIEQLGDVARGERELRLALATFRALRGESSLEVASCEQALGQAGQYRGDYAAALGHVERAAQIFAARLGPDHVRHGEALMGVGVIRYMLRDYPGALAAYEAALPILRAALGVGHTTVGLLEANLGEVNLALGRVGPARAQLTRALRTLERSLGEAHPYLALPLKGLGLAALAAGRAADAIAPLERALTLSTGAPTAPDPQELAEVRWGLARALRASGRERQRARELAEAAAATYRSLGPQSAARAAAVAAWLAAAP
jgi:tetratricopeptide (TPR) repeat protein